MDLPFHLSPIQTKKENLLFYFLPHPKKEKEKGLDEEFPHPFFCRNTCLKSLTIKNSQSSKISHLLPGMPLSFYRIHNPTLLQ